jgi:hypothetical protein
MEQEQEPPSWLAVETPFLPLEKTHGSLPKNSTTVVLQTTGACLRGWYHHLAPLSISCRTCERQKAGDPPNWSRSKYPTLCSAATPAWSRGSHHSTRQEKEAPCVSGVGEE